MHAVRDHADHALSRSTAITLLHACLTSPATRTHARTLASAHFVATAHHSLLLHVRARALAKALAKVAPKALAVKQLVSRGGGAGVLSRSALGAHDAAEGMSDDGDGDGASSEGDDDDGGEGNGQGQHSAKQKQKLEHKRILDRIC